MGFKRARLQILLTGWVVLLCKDTVSVSASFNRFQRACSLTRMPVIAAVRDPVSGDFVAVVGNSTTPGGGGGDGAGGSGLVPPSIDPDDNRNLRGGESPAMFISPNNRNAQEQFMQQQDVNEDDVIYVRQCFCFPDLYTNLSKPYCPIQKSICGIPQPWDLYDVTNVGCFSNSSRTSLVRNAWPVILLWYLALLIYFVCTQQGRNARQFIVAKCCYPSLNEDLIRQMMGGNNDRRNSRRSRWRFFRRRQRDPQDVILEEIQRATEANQLAALENEDIEVPTQLALKTKRYQAPHHTVEDSSVADNQNQDDDDADDNVESCTICFAEIHDGDRVGALPCNHVFHVDCLKVWLPRRNVCPLCQTPNVASPQYPTRQGQEQDEGGSGGDMPPFQLEEPQTLNQEVQTLDETTTQPQLQVSVQHTEQDETSSSTRAFWRFSRDDFRGRTVLHRRQHNT